MAPFFLLSPRENRGGAERRRRRPDSGAPRLGGGPEGRGKGRGETAVRFPHLSWLEMDRGGGSSRPGGGGAKLLRWRGQGLGERRLRVAKLAEELGGGCGVRRS